MTNFTDTGYVIRFADGTIEPGTFATNRKRCWDSFCGRGGEDWKGRRQRWKKTGVRCVPVMRRFVLEDL